MRVVCYYTNWSVYRPGDAKFSPQNINPYLCTHLIYAFGGFTKDNTLKPFDKYQDIEKGGYAKFTGLKTYNKNLKTMLAIGGWNEGSSRFSSMVANPERRKEFAKNAIKFLRLNHFDGLDLDWEYPSFRDGGKPRDKDNYPLLVQDLREEFDKEAEKTGRPRLLLTMAVPAGIEYINKGFDVPKITRYVDWMNILSYDYHSAFEPSVNHHAPLYSLEEENEYNYDSDLNVHYSIKHYLKNGAEPSKLVVGIPTYGRSFTLLNPDAVDIGSPADGPGNMGEATRENGYLAYYEICQYVKEQDWEVEQPNSKVMGPFAFKDDQWVGYDDEEIVKRKAEYVAEHNLGGIMFWSIDNDDFRGKCHNKPYPLIEAGRAALLAAHGVTDDNLIAPTKKPLKSRTRTRTKTSNVLETEKPEKIQTRRRNRIKTIKTNEEESTTIRKTRRKDTKNVSNEEETSSYSSLKVVTPSYTTPAPPPTPDMDGDFKCEDDGFYPHPKDCKKYYWCLSGAGDSGIIAHQFTCPAGLYFNKAADSCDYSQNVLCSKKTQKVTTASQDISPGSTTSSPSSTSRAPPKITAATSRTTFVQTSTTTTTEAYEEDEEYEDDEDEDKKKESEEDPKVIKELIELIKKAGGLEELEKQLNAKSNVDNNSEQPTTKSSLSKTLYERVLSKAIKNTPTTIPSPKSRNSVFRNSRGPQSEKTEEDVENTTTRKSERAKLQYTSISRSRPAVSRDTEEDSEDDEEIEEKSTGQTTRKITDKFPVYTNIRRGRISTTTKAPENDRNKILGEVPVDEDDIEDDDDTDSIEELASTTKKTNMPQYVNIRRQRPSTTEEIPASRYSEIRRGTTTESVSTEAPISLSTTSKYKQIRRGTTTAITKKPSTEETQFLSTDVSQDEIPVTEPESSETELGSTTLDKSSDDTSEDNRNILNVITTTTTKTFITTTDDINTEINETKTTEKPNLPSKPNLFNPIQRKRPQLFEPRPFSKPTEAPTKPPATQTTKVSYDFDSKIDKIVKEKPSINFRSRGTSRFNSPKTADQEDESEIKQITPKRRLGVREKYTEDHRTYRPSELADLSSLTAVDFDNIKELHAQTNQRRRRPTTTTQSPEIAQKSTSPFKRRRINVNINDLSKNSPTTERNTVADSSPSISRNRKIIRRFRTRTQEITTPTSTTTTVYVKPTKSLLDVALNDNEVDDDNFEDAITEEYENIKLSESNIRENSDINSFGIDPKLKNKLFGKSSVFDKKSGLVDVSSTETTISKITPTESSKITYINSEPVFGRKRKIIRKFRPTFNRKNSTEQINEDTKSNESETIEKLNQQNKTEESKVPKRIFRPRENIRRFTPLIIEPETTSPKYSQKNRGPNRTYRPKFDITTSTESNASSQKYSFVPRRTTKATSTTIAPDENTITTTSTHNLISTKTTSQQPTTTIESDENTIATTLTRNLISAEYETSDTEYSITEDTTTEENISDTTTKMENIDIIHTEIPTTMTVDVETTTIELEEAEVTTESLDQTTDSAIATDTTTDTPLVTTEALQQSTAEYKSNILRPIETRPKFIPSKLKNLSINENTETSSFKPRINYRNKLQSTTISTSTSEKEKDAILSTKINKRLNKFRPSSRNEDIKSLENSPRLSINKNLYKYKRPKQITKSEENNDEIIEDNINSSSVKKQLSNNNITQQDIDDIEDATVGNEPYREKSEESNEKEDESIEVTGVLKYINADGISMKPLHKDDKLIEEKATELDVEEISTTEYSPHTITSSNETPTIVTNVPETTETLINVDTRNENSFDNQQFSTEENIVRYRKTLREETTKSIKEVDKISDDIEEKISNRKYSPYISSTTIRPSNKPYLRSSFPKTVTEESQSKDINLVKIRNRNLFNNRKPNSNLFNPEEKDEENNVNNSKNYSRYIKPKKEESSKPDEKEDTVDNKKEKSPKRKYSPNVSSTTLRPSNKPYYLEPSSSTAVPQELKDIDTDAVRTRNKNLFNSRKANFNIFTHSTTPSTVTTDESILSTTIVPEETSTYIDTDITYNTSPLPESTSLIHVFAEKDEKIESEKTNESMTNKVERLIEVNRIVNVKTKEDKVKNHHVEHVTDEESSILDKIGAINRVTVIKVVDKDGKLLDNSESNYTHTTESPIKSSVDMIIQIAKIEEVPSKNLEKINLTNISVDINPPVSQREERKLDLTGSKIDYSKHESNGKAEIFGGLSHINIITPRSVHLTESSTIALEGLFQTEKPNIFTNKNSINEELLETENSKFVNIRVLQPDEGYKTNKKILEKPKIIPIKILKQDDDIVMKAKVVEVSTKSQFNMFKIVPIKVETAKRLPPPLPLIRINRQYN
ncbi:mucin-2-like [Diorhabda sublineata]|uniref:mucin-2-like n=1 Tax=Diorhabda sublineata TaxID=1163346 RepID=UPI0024E17E9C|nr:mucin-2-like [Diorhabda sublineata]